jgi:cysteine synthase A
VFADQFETLANMRAHYAGTAAELWAQTGGRLHAFVAGSGTGGTLAGVSRYLKVAVTVPSSLSLMGGSGNQLARLT